MKLIAEKCAKNDKLDKLIFQRKDGTTTQSVMPRQGILPHDLVHYVVESQLPFRYGFLSLIAAGANAEFVMGMAHDQSNPEVALEAVQVEAMVEALQTQMWAACFDRQAFADCVKTACEAHNFSAPDLLQWDIKQDVFAVALDLQRSWQALPYYQRLELDFKTAR